MSDGHHIAQVNIALPREPLESPALAEFVELLEPVNALADAAPGFVWRLQTDDGDATSIRAFEDERLIINMSVWETIEALWEFVYSGEHLGVMRRRREWMERIESTYLALWWVPAGTVPTIEKAKERIEILAERGPSAEAFTFKQRFPKEEPCTQASANTPSTPTASPI